MEQFREWWQKHRASVSPHTCQSARGENLACLADAEIWRVALEEILSQLKRPIYSADIMKWIEKELGDT